MTLKSVSIIGSGNVATHLAKALFNKQIKIINIWSRNILHAESLANLVDAAPISDIGQLLPVDLIIVCVSDSAISEVSNSLTSKEALIVHTSGSTPAEILNKHTNFGVLYPFQTFSKEVDIDTSAIPFFIEANTSDNEKALSEIASKISSNVRVLNSEQRLKLHLAAVFANNFSNHMFAIAKDILSEANLPFGILSHLIQETATKVIHSADPASVQTGPAVRKNYNIMQQHNEILARKPLWQKIYTFVSDSIIDQGNNK